MEGCIFCAIAEGKQPSTILYRDDEVVAFADIAPQAPVHVLLVPKKHIANLEEMTDDDAQLVGRLIATARQVARDTGVAANGYRLVINCGPQGGQTVPHLHVHLIGGKQLSASMA